MHCVGKSNPTGTIGILRTTTPYVDTDTDGAFDSTKVNYADKFHNRTNEVAKRVLGAYGFRVLDAWQVLRNEAGKYDRRAELTTDGVHYGGPGSLWTTNVLLNMIC